MEERQDKILCGLDEAGRGPLAGPVTAGCVILDPGFPRDLLRDSKTLSESQREEAFRWIVDHARAWGIGWAWPGEIDKINILRASLLAMKRAYEAMGVVADEGAADGNFAPDLGIPCRAVVKGDALIPQISAASILAKVARDRWMVRYSWIDDRFGFDKHKGYPTRAHQDALEKFGPSPIHRKSFRVKKSRQPDLLRGEDGPT